MSNQYVVIREHSAGNESVGETWQETKVFDGATTLDEMMGWAMHGGHVRDASHSRQKITITKPHQ